MIVFFRGLKTILIRISLVTHKYALLAEAIQYRNVGSLYRLQARTKDTSAQAVVHGVKEENQ
jgi:hypothetical protein